MTARLILAFDTSAGHCSVALLSDDTLLEAVSEDMTRGQAERLLPLIEEVLARADVTLHDLTRIGVGIGPGNFTGLRISVALARGLALGLGIPAVGVSTFDALRNGRTGFAAVSGPRDTAYLAHDGHPPRIVARTDVPHGTPWPGDPRELVEAIARQAALNAGATPPAPLYVRPADAAPPRDVPPVILDDA